MIFPHSSGSKAFDTLPCKAGPGALALKVSQVTPLGKYGTHKTVKARFLALALGWTLLKRFQLFPVHEHFSVLLS